MTFEPKKITKEHVLSAVKIIDEKGIELIQSTRFDLIVGEKAYPPKDIMRHAHKIMNGTYIWERSGGEPTNKYLIALGFEIQEKNPVANSHFNKAKNH